MKGAKVLDSWALLAYFEGQAAGAKVKQVLKEAEEEGTDLYISVVNWGEILYVTETRYGADKRDEIESLMNQMHLEVVDVDKGLAREAAHLKASHGLPYADCFAASLAKARKVPILTGDKDFKHLADEVKIDWL